VANENAEKGKGRERMEERPGCNVHLNGIRNKKDSFLNDGDSGNLNINMERLGAQNLKGNIFGNRKLYRQGENNYCADPNAQKEAISRIIWRME